VVVAVVDDLDVTVVVVRSMVVVGSTAEVGGIRVSVVEVMVVVTVVVGVVGVPPPGEDG
jgi:hypothetical protein